MAQVILELRTKVRALITDLSKSDTEIFTYESGDTIFILQEENINEISSVAKNGTALGSGDYSFDSDTNELTITVALSANDIITVKYTYYKYSDTELDEYVRASLVWLSIFDATEKDFEIESGDIYPTPNNQEEDIIALIASILIKPDWSEYRLPNLTVRYPRKFDKEEKIEKLINRWTRGLGVNDVLEWD